jgi:hypothetical protein
MVSYLLLALMFVLPFTTAALLHLLCPGDAGRRRPRLRAAIWIAASTLAWTGSLVLAEGFCPLETGVVFQLWLFLQVMVASVFWAAARGAYEVVVRPFLPPRRRAARR